MRCRCLFFLLIASAVAASEVRALPDPLPECYSAWLFFGQNFERGDDPEEALLEAQQAFGDYTRQMSRLDVDELDLGFLHDRFDSVEDLVGRETAGRSPPLLRAILENSTRVYSENVWPEEVLGRPCGLVDAVVVFRDGKTVRLEAEVMTVEFGTGRFKGFDYRVDENSIKGPNGRPD